MARTREYNQAIGYATPYRWAHHVDAPFQPLAHSRVAIITTAAPFDPSKGDQDPGARYNGGAKFYRVYYGDRSKTHDLRPESRVLVEPSVYVNLSSLSLRASIASGPA
jgi:D-proline reductase (dithiol) PrdB